MDSNRENPVSSKFVLLNFAGSKQIFFNFFSFQNSPDKKKRVAKSPGKVVKVRPKRQSAKIPATRKLNGVLRRFLANIRRWQSGRTESDEEEEQQQQQHVEEIVDPAPEEEDEQHTRIEEVVDIDSDEPEEPNVMRHDYDYSDSDSDNEIGIVLYDVRKTPH